MSDEAESTFVSASQEVEAPAAIIFELIADPARQPEWDGNHNLGEAAPGQRVHAVGDMFLMGLDPRFATPTAAPIRENHIVEFEEGRLIAWLPSELDSPPPGHLWRWQVEPLGEHRSRVTHSYDWSKLSDPVRFKRARNTTSEKLARSISRLAALAESENRDERPGTPDRPGTAGQENV